jgi:hypothetical protein
LEFISLDPQPDAALAKANCVEELKHFRKKEVKTKPYPWIDLIQSNDFVLEEQSHEVEQATHGFHI